MKGQKLIKATPGDIIEYHCSYTNVSNKTLKNIKATLPIPEGWDELYPQMKAHIVAGFSGDKTSAKVLKMLAPMASSFIFTKSENYRAADPDRLLEISRELELSMACSVEHDPYLAYDKARVLAERGGSVLVTGSIYLLGAVLEGMK